jgi:hypothetical protein
MCHGLELCREYFAQLAEIDEQLARWVADRGCPNCGGPLHRGDYQRKPRGALFAIAGETFCQRASLCCGRVGCRKRALPPSVRFLGRRVYLEAVILVACVYVQAAGAFEQARRALAVPVRTLKRWRHWWQNDFARSREWQAMRARFAPPAPAETELPQSLLQRLAAGMPCTPDATTPEVLLLAARWLLPITTRCAV